MKRYTDLEAANNEIARLQGELIKSKLKDNDRQRQFNTLVGSLSVDLEKAHKTAPVAVSEELINRVRTIGMVGYHETMDTIKLEDQAITQSVIAPESVTVPPVVTQTEPQAPPSPTVPAESFDPPAEETPAEPAKPTGKK